MEILDIGFQIAKLIIALYFARECFARIDLDNTQTMALLYYIAFWGMLLLQ